MKIIVFVFVYSILIALVSGAILEETGKEPHDFADVDGGSSVIIAKVQQIKKMIGDEYSATFIPQAALAGSFDPSLHANIVMDFSLNKMTSTIDDLPHENSYVIVVIRQNKQENSADWSYRIIDACIYHYMPNGSAMVVLKGLDDPLIPETLKKIQDARAHPDPDPNAPKPSTQPASP